jgi:hypothetical protein
MVITKESETAIKIIETKERIVELSSLLATKSFMEKEIAGKQKKLDDINNLITEAEKLGLNR